MLVKQAKAMRDLGNQVAVNDRFFLTAKILFQRYLAQGWGIVVHDSGLIVPLMIEFPAAKY
jgi:hypothetical protein